MPDQYGTVTNRFSIQTQAILFSTCDHQLINLEHPEAKEQNNVNKVMKKTSISLRTKKLKEKKTRQFLFNTNILNFSHNKTNIS